jgi:ssDNA-binding Zn-finger/Zn-ribbon topoisomerase 1
MRNGICPKCNSKAVYATNAYDEHFVLPKNEKDAFVGKLVKSEIISSERYVCAACGYFERYVSNREFLNAVTQSASWIKV